jgi:hypothetical protein
VQRGGAASIGDGGGVRGAGMVLRSIQVPSSPFPSVVARRRAGTVAAVVAGGVAGFDGEGAWVLEIFWCPELRSLGDGTAAMVWRTVRLWRLLVASAPPWSWG